MKKSSLLAIAACAFATAARAELHVYESFEQATPGALGGQNTGEGFTGLYAGTARATVVRDPQTRMTYSGGAISVDGGLTYMKLSGAVSKDEYPFARQISQLEDDGSPVYISFLCRVASSSVSAGDLDEVLLGLSNGDGSTTVFGLSYGNNTESSNNSFGVRTAAHTGGSTTVVAGQTYFLVFRIDKNGTSYLRRTSLVVNPTTSAEPETWDVAYYNSGLKRGIGDYRWLNAYYKSSNEAEDSFEFDEIRIGRSWADVTGPTTLNGVVPAPVPSIEKTSEGFVVKIVQPMPNYNVYYTTDGSAPSASNGTLYTAPFSLSQSATVRSVAVASGGATSAVVLTPCNFEAHWTGAGADDDWTTSGNWSPSGSPANKAIVFGAEDRTTSGTVNSVVSQDMTVRSLCFTNNNFAPAVETANAHWHVIKIDEGKTLTVNGMDGEGCSLKLWSPRVSQKNMYVPVAFTGGGKLDIDSADSNILLEFTSTGEASNTYLDFSGLSEFTCTASVFTICRGRRPSGYVNLAKAGIGKNRLTLDALYVSDNWGDDQGGKTVYLRLGQDNEINADVFYVGAPSAGHINFNDAKLEFAAGLSNPTVKIRAKDGVGRADFKVGSHGENVAATARSMTVAADFTGGIVDARVGNLVVGNGRGFQTSNQYGGHSATLSVAAGTFDALSAVVGRSQYTSGSRSVNARLATGTVNISDGTFAVAEDFELGINEKSAYQGVKGTVTLTGGTLTVGGNMTLATRLGLATNVVANVNVSNGSLFVLGNLASGEAITNLQNAAHIVNLQADVNALGGVIAVTNVAGTSELRLESGTLALAGGKVYADSLVMTNEASTVSVELSDAGFTTAEVGALKLGGNLSVTLADGFKTHGGMAWHVVEGRSARTGTFETVDLPEGLRVCYTANGFDIATEGGFTIIVR